MLIKYAVKYINAVKEKSKYNKSWKKYSNQNSVKRLGWCVCVLALNSMYQQNYGN